jgi:hypothetical protein
VDIVGKNCPGPICISAPPHDAYHILYSTGQTFMKLLSATVNKQVSTYVPTLPDQAVRSYSQLVNGQYLR